MVTAPRSIAQTCLHDGNVEGTTLHTAGDATKNARSASARSASISRHLSGRVWGLSLALVTQAGPVPLPIQNPDHLGYCFDYAAQTEQVNATVLMAIAWHESHFLPWRVHRNRDGSFDYGLMQINSTNLASLHLNKTTVMQVCNNIVAGARLYRRAVRRYGNTWAAVGAYHSITPALQQAWAKVETGV